MEQMQHKFEVKKRCKTIKHIQQKFVTLKEAICNM